MNQECCKKVENRWKSDNASKYPATFSVSNYCTTAVLEQLDLLKRDNCVKSFPRGEGFVKIETDIIKKAIKKPNPRDMAKELRNQFHGTRLKNK